MASPLISVRCHVYFSQIPIYDLMQQIYHYTCDRIKAKKDVKGMEMMDMFDEARAMSGTLKLCNITQKELGKRMGVSQSYIANKLRLLTLSPRVEEIIRQNKISERHARCILRLDSEAEQLDVLKKVVSRGLTVRECEALVDMKVDSYIPGIIERADNLDRIDTFMTTLKRSLDTLRSFGIDINDQTSYYGNKMYVTLCFNEI